MRGCSISLDFSHEKEQCKNLFNELSNKLLLNQKYQKTLLGLYCLSAYLCVISLTIFSSQKHLPEYYCLENGLETGISNHLPNRLEFEQEKNIKITNKLPHELPAEEKYNKLFEFKVTGYDRIKVINDEKCIIKYCLNEEKDRPNISERPNTNSNRNNNNNIDNDKINNNDYYLNKNRKKLIVNYDSIRNYITEYDAFCDYDEFFNSLSTMITIGRIIGSLVFSYISDKYGRLLAFKTSLYIMFFSYVLILVFKSRFVLYIFHLASSLGISLSLVIVCMGSENMEQKNFNILNSLISALFSLSGLVCVSVMFLFRNYLLIYYVQIMLMLVLLNYANYYILESFSFFLLKESYEECLQNILYLNQINDSNLENDFILNRKLIRLEKFVDKLKHSRAGSDYFKPKKLYNEQDPTKDFSEEKKECNFRSNLKLSLLHCKATSPKAFNSGDLILKKKLTFQERSEPQFTEEFESKVAAENISFSNKKIIKYNTIANMRAHLSTNIININNNESHFHDCNWKNYINDNNFPSKEMKSNTDKEVHLQKKVSFDKITDSDYDSDKNYFYAEETFKNNSNKNNNHKKNNKLKKIFRSLKLRLIFLLQRTLGPYYEIFAEKNQLIILLKFFPLFLTANLIYYGVYFKIELISDNIYLATLLLFASEILGELLSGVLLNIAMRKTLIFGGFCFNAFLYILAMLYNCEFMNYIVILFGTFSISIVFVAIIVLSAETFEMRIKNTMCSLLCNLSNTFMIGFLFLTKFFPNIYFLFLINIIITLFALTFIKETF